MEMKVHIYDLAMQDIQGLYKRWQTDRTSLWGVEGIPYRAFSKQFCLWRLFTTEQLAEICIHWKERGVEVYRPLGIKDYLAQRKRSAIPRFKELIEGKGVISYNMPLHGNMTKKQILGCIDQYLDASRRSRLAGIGCFEDPEIKAVFEKKLGRPIRESKKTELPVKAAIIKLKSRKVYWKSSCGCQLQRIMVRYYGDFDKGRKLWEIFCQALRGKIHRNCSSDSDTVFLDLLRVLEIDGYDECKEYLPTLAEYLAEKRAGGYKREIFFPNHISFNHDQEVINHRSQFI